MAAIKNVFVFLLLLSPVVTAQAASAALLEALTYVPQSVQTVEFTDVSLIKRYANANDLTSTSSEEAQINFFRDVSEHHVMLLGNFELATSEHARVWAWNAADLRWSVQISINAPLTIFALRDDYAMQALISLLEERDFTTTQLGAATLYQHPMDMNAEWLPVNLSSLNTAILGEENIIIMSSSEEAIRDVLEAHINKTTYAWVDSIQTISEQLGEAATVFLETNNCVAFSASAIMKQLLGSDISQEKLEEIIEELGADLAQVSPYQTLALAYRYEGDKPLGTLLFNYRNTTQASNDLAARQKSAEEGISLATNLLYKETVFTLESAFAEGNNLIFSLRPVKSQPARLFQMLYQRDMAFAGC